MSFVLFHDKNFEIIQEGDQCIDGIMASGAGKTEKQGDVCVQYTVVTGELEQGIVVIILAKVTVPSLRSRQELLAAVEVGGRSRT